MDNFEEVLKSLPDNEKIDRLGMESNYYYTKILVMSLQSDELKLQMIDKLYDYDKLDLIKSLKSDDLKVQALSLFNDNDDRNKSKIIVTMQSDEKKIEAMKEHIKNQVYCEEIILSLKSNNNKMEYLHLLRHSVSITKLLEDIVFQNDEERLDVVKKINIDWVKLILLKDLKDEKKLEVLETWKLDDSTKVELITTFPAEQRVTLLKYLSYDENKAEVIITLPQEERMNFLSEIKSPVAQEKIINSIMQDEIKLQGIQDIEDDTLKTRILISLEDDKLKLTQAEQLGIENEDNVASIICSVKDDKTKLKLAKNMKDSKNIALIGMALRDRKKQREIFLKENRRYSEIGIDKSITIGMEIESEGPKSGDIIKLGGVLLTQNENSGEIRGWETKCDGSLEDEESRIDSPNGVEIVSPILRDTKEDIEDIYMVCEMMQKCGHEVTEKCGGHIHIGADYLTSKESYINLFEIWGNCEEVIYKISNEEEHIPRLGFSKYAKPISPKLNEAIENDTINIDNEEELEQFIGKIQAIQGDRYSGLNLLNINNGKNTIEFRIPNGTINPDTWIENAKLFGRIVQVSQKLAEIQRKSEISNEEKQLVELADMLKEEIPEQEKMELLLKLLFSKDERSTYRDRYVTNSELLMQTPDEKNPFRTAEYKEVDFKKKKKHTLDEFGFIAISERSGNINGVVQETRDGVRTEGEIEHGRNMEEQ